MNFVGSGMLVNKTEAQIKTDVGQLPDGIKPTFEAESNLRWRRPRSERQIQDVASNSSASIDDVQFAITLINGKWKLPILCRLGSGPVRLSQLRRLFPEASKKVLVQHLREMEKDGLVLRTDLSRRVRHVEYSLSHPRGLAVLHLINILARWSAQYGPRPPGPISAKALA
jgi:DNA-binding HxlR family transcriptional regulator